MKLAAAAYRLDWHDDLAGVEAKLDAWVAEGAAQGADLLVFPEYAAMELAAIGGPAVAADQDLALALAADLRPWFEETNQRLAARHAIHILSGSGPARTGTGHIVNRATLHGPGGIIGHQDKQIMTRFEAEDWDVRPGEGLHVLDTPFARIGVTICYDSEFPLLARRLVEGGVNVLLSPACTETVAGHWRVKVGSMARALENQCVVVHAPLVGDAPWCAGVETCRGTAAIYGPPDAGWPETGILAEGIPDSPGWVMAEVDSGLIARTRADGVTLNHLDWPRQLARLA